MKYEIIDRVSRFVERFGMIMDPETMNKARDEAEEYDFRKISEGHHAVRHGKKMYVIIERDGEIGCSCDDMEYNRMDGAVCKHIIAFTRLITPVTEGIEGSDAAYLMNACGWTGAELHPEIELGGPGAVVQEDTTPAHNEPEGKIYTRRCKHCDEVYSGNDLSEVKKQYSDHLKVCGMNQRAKPYKEASNPESKDPTPKGRIPPDPDLDLSVDDPLPEPKKPLGDRLHRDRSEEPKQKPEEEKKMSEGKPAWDQEAWDNATQGSYVSYNEGGIATVLFTSNDFEIGEKPDTWGRTPFEFSVIQHKKAVILSVGAIGLMNALKEILPLENKIIKIIRTGAGTGTKYEVQDVTDTEVIR